MGAIQGSGPIQPSGHLKHVSLQPSGGLDQKPGGRAADTAPTPEQPAKRGRGKAPVADIVATTADVEAAQAEIDALEKEAQDAWEQKWRDSLEPGATVTEPPPIPKGERNKFFREHPDKKAALADATKRAKQAGKTLKAANSPAATQQMVTQPISGGKYTGLNYLARYHPAQVEIRAARQRGDFEVGSAFNRPGLPSLYDAQGQYNVQPGAQ